jgi:hypothetical protein
MELLKDLFFKIIEFVDTIYTLLFFSIPLDPPINLLGFQIKQIQLWSIIGGGLFILLFVLWLRKKIL